jgi:putative ABC transport system permease protein
VSFSEKIEPMITRFDLRSAFCKSPGDPTNTLKTIKDHFEALANGEPFDYSFLDDDFNRQYAADQRTAGLFTVFSGLAMIIAALGIFGFVTTTTEQRTRELGIRRVLGATINQLLFLLLKEFRFAVVLAILIALPAGAWIMHGWLQGFAYRTSGQPWIFITAPMCAIFLAISIVWVKAARIARTNLAETLRVE